MFKKWHNGFSFCVLGNILATAVSASCSHSFVFCSVLFCNFQTAVWSDLCNILLSVKSVCPILLVGDLKFSYSNHLSSPHLLSYSTADRPDRAWWWYFTHADLIQITSPWKEPEPCRAKAMASAGNWGGVAEESKMALVMIIIHSFIACWSFCPLSMLPLLLLCCPPHVRAARHAYQLSPGWSESTGSDGRRLVNSPEAAECLHQLIQLKCIYQDTHSCWFKELIAQNMIDTKINTKYKLSVGIHNNI